MNIIDTTCKNCGAQLKITSRFSKTVVCKYCNAVYLLENDQLDKVGVTKPFEPLSILKVGATGSYDGKPLQVLGRIRLEDDEDAWDEWYVTLGGVPFWIEESSDSLELISSVNLQSPLPLYEQIMVGQVVDVNGTSVFISERGQAQVVGIEGEFTGRVKPSEAYAFIQGYGGETLYMIEYYANEIKVFSGSALALDKLKIDAT